MCQSSTQATASDFSTCLYVAIHEEAPLNFDLVVDRFNQADAALKEAALEVHLEAVHLAVAAPCEEAILEVLLRLTSTVARLRLSSTEARLRLTSTEARSISNSEATADNL